MAVDSVLVTGAGGMLGAAVVESWQDALDVYATGRRTYPGNRAQRFLEFDLSGSDYGALRDFADPDVVVNFAAMTVSDVCERHPDLARAINATAVGKLVEAFPRATLVQVSTDAVYAPDVSMAREEDPTAPQNVYARTKLEGEEYALGADNSLVLRTTIVGFNRNPAKTSFLEWLLDGLENARPMRLFTDVLFSPLTIWDFADLLKRSIGQNLRGLFNVAGGERISKHDFGIRLAEMLGLAVNHVDAGRLADAGLQATRRLDQSLDCSAFEEALGTTMPDIDTTLRAIRAHYAAGERP